MISREGSTSTRASLLSHSSLAALVASSLALFGSILTVQKISHDLADDQVTINLNSLNWLSQIPLGLDQPQNLEPSTAQVIAAAPTTTPAVSQPAVLPAAKNASAKRRLARVAKVAKRKMAPTRDTIQIAQASEVQVMAPEVIDEAAETARMQAAHQMLRIQFRVAVAEPDKAQELMLAHTPASLMFDELTTVTSHPVTTQGPVIAKRSPKRPKRPVESVAAVIAAQSDQDQKQVSIQDPASQDQGPRAPSYDLHEKAAESRMSQPDSKVTTQTGLTNAPGVGAGGGDTPASADEPTDFASQALKLAMMTGYGTFEHGAGARNPALNPNAAAPRGDYPKTRPIEPQPQGKKHIDRHGIRPDDGMDSQASACPVTTQVYQEAFSDGANIQQPVSLTLVTQEFPSMRCQRQAGWEIAQAAEHLPTLYRHNDGVAPLISSGNLNILKFLIGPDLQAGTGLVFGKIAPGWSFTFSGRSEHPLFLDSKMHRTSDQNMDDVRYFVLWNTAPGAHVLYLTEGFGKPSQAAIAVPVVAGTATYLDLTALQKTQGRGYVLNGSVPEPYGIPGVELSFYGNSAAATTTAQDGFFQTPELLVVGDHPVIIDAKAKLVTGEGPTHRYQVSPGKLSNLQLYQMEPDHVQDWISQLQGGVSPESGLVVGAFPRLQSAMPKAELFPLLSPLVANSSLMPETYALSEQDYLEARRGMSTTLPRMVSVQVPEGANLLQVMDPSHAVVWSELVISSPQVVNMVGTY